MSGLQKSEHPCRISAPKTKLLDSKMISPWITVGVLRFTIQALLEHVAFSMVASPPLPPSHLGPAILVNLSRWYISQQSCLECMLHHGVNVGVRCWQQPRQCTEKLFYALVLASKTMKQEGWFLVQAHQDQRVVLGTLVHHWPGGKQSSAGGSLQPVMSEQQFNRTIICNISQLQDLTWHFTWCTLRCILMATSKEQQ